MHVGYFAKNITSIHINPESHCSEITCLLLTLILYLQVQAHTTIQKCVLFTKRLFAADFDFVPASASTHINPERYYSEKHLLAAHLDFVPAHAIHS